MRPVPGLPPRPIGQALALDLDGTVLRSDHSISPALVEAVARLAASGLPVVLVSGRPPRSVLTVAGELGTRGPMVALNGAMVIEPDGGIAIAQMLDAFVVAALLDLVETQPEATAHLYRGFDWLTTRDNTSVRRETEIIGFAPRLVTAGDATMGISKIMVVGPSDTLGALEEVIDAARWPVAVSRSKPTYLEITPAGVTKAVGLDFAARRHGLSVEDFIAFGDGDNDVPMFEACGFGVAMGNGSQRLKQVADIIIGTNDEDALANFLDGLLQRQAITAEPLKTGVSP